MNSIIAFTDGASKGNPGSGGWGVVIVDGDHIEELGGKEDKTTNNRMEMTAIREALSYAKKNNKPITIYTDSSYVINGITKWVFAWQSNNWKTKTGGSVLNQDIWKDLVALAGSTSVNWKALSGHVGIPGNERADSIASSFGDGNQPELYKGTIADYGINVMNFSADSSSVQKKKVSNERKGIKAYSYLSMIDGEIKIHKTWAECEDRVKGIKGAKFRKSVSEENEKEIINEWKAL